MKKWFLEHFLPMWAKETVLRDNRRLLDKNRELSRENDCLRSYVRGVHMALRRRKGETRESS